MRRLLLWGGTAGLVGGLVAQRAIDMGSYSTEYEWLVRGALVLPAIIFFLWWLLSPGIALEEPVEEEPVALDAEQRLERIEATFDSAAVPRARRTRFEHDVDDVERATYRDSIRRDTELAPVDPATFGIRRPARRDDASSSAS